jgi:uncharacterized membrane protein YeiH
VLTDPRYIEVIAAATLLGIFFGECVRRFHRLIAIVDALGLGAYAVYGVQKSLVAGLAVPAALLVGVINAAGGGMLRDLLSGEEPLVFKPGQFYLLVALAGTVCFVFCLHYLETSANAAALLSIALTFVMRMLTIAFNWRSAPVVWGAIFHSDDPPAPPAGR